MSTAGSSSLSPTTRSRTLLFISYRDSSVRSTRFSRSRTSYDEPYGAEDEHETLINASPGHVTLDVELPPKWYIYFYGSRFKYHFFIYTQGRFI